MVRQSEYFDKEIANEANIDTYYIVKKGDFVYNPRTSETAPVGPIKRNNLEDGIMSPLYTVFRFYDSTSTDFYEILFSTSTWHKYLYSVANYGARHDRMNILQNDLMSLPLPVVNKEEQKRIITFFSLLDKRVKLLTELLEVSKQVSIAISQQIFIGKGV